MFLINPYIFQASGNPLWDGLLAYYTADNTPNDALGTYDLTLYNGTTYTTGVINNGFSFDGVNDYAETTTKRIGHSNSDFFTLSCWINGTILNRGFVVDGEVGAGGTLGTWNSGAGIKISLLKGQGSAQCFGNTSLSSSTLYHLVVVHTPYDGVSANVQFYVNGSADGSAIFDIGTPTTSTVKQIGTKADKVTFYTGMIDEVGIWSRDLSASEVTELYNSGAGKQYPTGILPLWNGLQAYYTADNTPNDALGTYNGTLVNGATYGTGIINQGFSFDNVDDYFSLPDNTFTETGDFTISLWINPSTVSNDWFLHFGQYQTSPRQGILMYINFSGNLSVFLHNNGTDIGALSGGTLTASTWYHIVLTHTDGVDFKLYLNDVLVDTNTTTSTIDYPTPCIQTIGKGDNATRPFGGIIDEIGLFNTSKTQAEVTELYNSGAGKQYPN